MILLIRIVCVPIVVIVFVSKKWSLVMLNKIGLPFKSHPHSRKGRSSIHMVVIR